MKKGDCFCIDFWEKIIRMAKNRDSFFRHFRHNGENGEKIDGENGKNVKASYMQRNMTNFSHH